MKNTLSFLILLAFAASSALAQQSEAPRTEYTISVSDPVVTLKPGETKTTTLVLLKSRLYTKSKATLGFSSVLPEGLTISYEPAEGVFDSSAVTISASTSLPEGQYQVILKSTINHKIKGTVLKVVVDAKAIKKDAITVN
jgi:hypothetical protein